MHINRIMLSIHKDNKKTQHVYEKVGFLKEGILRKVFYKNGNCINALIYSIFKDRCKNSMGKKYKYKIIFFAQLKTMRLCA